MYMELNLCAQYNIRLAYLEHDISLFGHLKQRELCPHNTQYSRRTWARQGRHVQQAKNKLKKHK